MVVHQGETTSQELLHVSSSLRAVEGSLALREHFEDGAAIGQAARELLTSILSAAVRRRDRGVRLPAIALTAYARPEDRQKALLAGFDVHLPKPVEPAELVVVVAALVRRS